MGVKASVLFPFAVQTVYSMHFVHTNLHCCTIRLCNQAGRNYSNIVEFTFSGEEGLVDFRWRETVGYVAGDGVGFYV